MAPQPLQQPSRPSPLSSRPPSSTPPLPSSLSSTGRPVCSHEECPLESVDPKDLPNPAPESGAPGRPKCYLHHFCRNKERRPLLRAFARLDALGVVQVSDAHMQAADLTNTLINFKIFARCDFSECNLSGSRLRKVSFPGSTLSACVLERTILERCSLRDVTTMKAPRFHGAIFDRTTMPHPSAIVGPRKDPARKQLALNLAEASATPEESARQDLGAEDTDGASALRTAAGVERARDVMRNLGAAYRENGANEAAGLFYKLQMDVARRGGAPVERVWLTALWLIAGYGESPGRFAAFCAAVILAFAGLLHFSPIADGGGVVAEPSFLRDSLYFSATTFSTLGLGDVVPAARVTQFIACVEALIGSLCLGIFIVILSRQMDR